ncbi:nephronectin a isoform X7 [Echeneis naucrates]|uniref:nephronectin a isoform X7 n=1 Tax=Echeneis naucrates TaxID=173247 RepID=UPI001114610D|nr:nephronectin isoform X7 [Echeneis naucrates]
MEFWIKLMLLYSCCFGASADFDGRWPRQMASSSGLCRYGARVDCCWGWTRHSWGHCQPLFALTHRIVGIRCQPQAVCQPGCKHGNCVGPNKCKCQPGFTGKTCNQDARTCGMANCQYGCEVLKGEVRCQCPSPGLQLAPDGRTCVDVDECAAGTAVCPTFRKCINTFGSYICKCFEGFDLQYINGKYQCIDVDECALGQSHCSSSATCYNTPGSFKCKCKDGYRGMGHDCKPIPKVAIEPPRPGKQLPSYHNHIPDLDQRRTTTTTTTTHRPPVTPKRTFHFIPKSITTTTPTTAKTVTKAPLPPKRVTPPLLKPSVPTWKPFIPNRKPPVSTRKPYSPPRPAVPTRQALVPPPITPVDNTIQKEVTKQRGDVHIPRNHGHNNVLGIDFDIELGNTADEAKDDPESGYLSCSFDDGLCGWIRDKDGDLHWETTPDPSGGRYLTIPEIGNKRSGRGARLVLPLTPPWNDGNLCLSFRHKLAGHHVGMLQVFVKKGKQYSPAVWGRTGGNGWRHTQITLWGTGLESVILKGERGRGRSGEMAVDDITLRKGSCTEEHNLRRL